MTPDPRVSVLLPCRAAAATLDASLGSMAAQTFASIQIIAVDDGSSDGTPELLAEWARRDARVESIQTPPRGIVAALNSAAGRARGEVLARMDADDIADPRRFERQMAFLDANPG
ncbi:MAG: glycosyltransferase family A protein, partial [Gemmatimonadales bacterium]